MPVDKLNCVNVSETEGAFNPNTEYSLDFQSQNERLRRQKIGMEKTEKNITQNGSRKR